MVKEELIELLKWLAERLLRNFKTIKNIVNASPQEISKSRNSMQNFNKNLENI